MRILIAGEMDYTGTDFAIVLDFLLVDASLENRHRASTGFKELIREAINLLRYFCSEDLDGIHKVAVLMYVNTSTCSRQR